MIDSLGLKFNRNYVEGELEHGSGVGGGTVGFFGNNPLTRRTVDFQGTSLNDVATTLALLLQALGDTFQGYGLINTNV